MKNNLREHYQKLDIEPIEYIKSLGILEEFCVGNIIKYISRYKNKGGLDDLNKANQYLTWLVECQGEEKPKEKKVRDEPDALFSYKECGHNYSYFENQPIPKGYVKTDISDTGLFSYLFHDNKIKAKIFINDQFEKVTKFSHLKSTEYSEAQLNFEIKGDIHVSFKGCFMPLVIHKEVK